MVLPIWARAISRFWKIESIFTGVLEGSLPGIWNRNIREPDCLVFESKKSIEGGISV